MSDLALFFNAFARQLSDRDDKALEPWLSDTSLSGRINIHHNTITSALYEALKTAYPVLLTMMGDGYFKSLAHLFRSQFPLKSSTLTHYGKEFPEFLKQAPGIDQAPYLIDVAKLDWAAHVSNLAPEVTALTLQALQDQSLTQNAPWEPALLPSVQLLDLEWPISELWYDHKTGSDLNFDIELEFSPISVCLWKQGGEMKYSELNKAERAFLMALMRKNALALASHSALQTDPDLETAAMIAELIDMGLFCDPQFNQPVPKDLCDDPSDKIL